jgi:hypothetical protein
MNSSVIHWLLDSDPSIRWQVMRDLTYAVANADANELAAERARVATEGWGAHQRTGRGGRRLFWPGHPGYRRPAARRAVVRISGSRVLAQEERYARAKT